MPRLFEPFVQAERTLNRAGGGLGLGLALVRGLVELHGGEVTAHSAGSGQGATFVGAPSLWPRRRWRHQRRGAPPVAAHRRRRVLVIDDDEDVTNAAQARAPERRSRRGRCLRRRPGPRTARAFKPDVVLCDIRMPGMDGYEVARAFRADPERRDVLLVALTGYAADPSIATTRARRASTSTSRSRQDMAQLQGPPGALSSPHSDRECRIMIIKDAVHRI